MTVAVTRMSLVALLTLLCTFTVGSAGTASADDAPNSGVDTAKVADKSFPPSDEFIAFDDGPVPIELPQPLYPDSAIKAGIEGNVRVRVLIDKEGKVRDALIEKSSGKEVGFEEAALAAARQATWKPAIFKNEPVAVWVSYAIKFALTREK